MSNFGTCEPGSIALIPCPHRKLLTSNFFVHCVSEVFKYTYRRPLLNVDLHQVALTIPVLGGPHPSDASQLIQVTGGQTLSAPPYLFWWHRWEEGGGGTLRTLHIIFFIHSTAVHRRRRRKEVLAKTTLTDFRYPII